MVEGKIQYVANNWICKWTFLFINYNNRVFLIFGTSYRRYFINILVVKLYEFLSR